MAQDRAPSSRAPGVAQGRPQTQTRTRLFRRAAAGDDDGAAKPGKTSSGPAAEQWKILINCDSEEQQCRLLEQFEKQKLKCRALAS
jgi:hypothetical protein